MGNTKTRQEGGIASVSDQDLGVMAGEISPDIMFGKNGQRGGNMGTDMCGGVCMGALGSRDTGGQESKVIRG